MQRIILDHKLTHTPASLPCDRSVSLVKHNTEYYRVIRINKKYHIKTMHCNFYGSIFDI